MTTRKIVVMPAAWVLIGDYAEDATHITLTNASVIRYWGTTAGLGEIALYGPTKKTVMDPCGVFRCRKGAELFTLDCAYVD